MTNYIDTDKVSMPLREKAIDINRKSILITNFQNTEQEKDLSEPPNCDGYGRVRHFKLGDGKDWPINPLPIYPAQKALGLSFSDNIQAQVFQNAVCNWRCWYCFVDFQLLSGNRKFSNHLECQKLIEMYMSLENPALVIDLTGGQPDLTPEWIPWMMEELINNGLSESVYLWSDDNLSNDYFWRYLNSKQIDLIKSYKLYGRVCCFKGIDECSFSHNTGADPSLFSNQFILWERLLKTGIDLYSYITLPAKTDTDFRTTICAFFDRIQQVDEFYPLRIIPLKVEEFTPVVKRVKDLQKELLEGQRIAINVWNEELNKRFSKEQLGQNITEVKTKYQYE